MGSSGLKQRKPRNPMQMIMITLGKAEMENTADARQTQARKKRKEKKETEGSSRRSLSNKESTWLCEILGNRTKEKSLEMMDVTK